MPSGRRLAVRSLEEFLAAPGVRQTLDAITARLIDGYDDASDNYRPSAGSDGRTNGIDTYTFTWHQIRESGIVKVTSHEPYRFELDGEMIACHRVAQNSPVDIDVSFPSNRDDWPITFPRQLGLAFHRKTAAQHIFVLAHAGNPAQGMLEVYLCRPLVDENHRLERWLETKLIWKNGADVKALAAPPPQKNPTTLPAEEHKPLAMAKKKPRKPKKDERDGSGE